MKFIEQKYINILSKSSDCLINMILLINRNIVFNAGLIDGQVYTPIDKNQTENHIRLKDRAHTVFHWKVELERNNTEITAEIESILGITQRLMRCSRAVELIKTIDGDIKKIRNMRLESDLVHDSLTDELIKVGSLINF